LICYLYSFAFGLKADVKDNLFFVDESVVAFPCGAYVILYNIETKTQKFLSVSGNLPQNRSILSSSFLESFAASNTTDTGSKWPQYSSGVNANGPQSTSIAAHHSTNPTTRSGPSGAGPASFHGAADHDVGAAVPKRVAHAPHIPSMSFVVTGIAVTLDRKFLAVAEKVTWIEQGGLLSASSPTPQYTSERALVTIWELSTMKRKKILFSQEASTKVSQWSLGALGSKNSRTLVCSSVIIFSEFFG
jgi:hypothetical protein